MADQSLTASNGILAIGIVAAAFIVIVVKPANIDLTQEQEQEQSQSTAPASSGNPLTAILGFLGL
jgi:hypothetical protein